MSIESQRRELERTFGAQAGIEIVAIFEESKSAKAPGRPMFNAMMERLERGEAEGIVAWAPDRLARNSIDGGQIVYRLDTGILRDLKFATYTFENNPQGKFMLSIMFGQSKYYSDALSENVKRGNRTKVENGWRPNKAPLGYRNDPATKTILPDPVHFPLIRRMFEMVLAGTHTPRQIVSVARDEWGFLSPKFKRIGGTLIGRSTVYKVLKNPFYAGLLHWNGQVYQGKHEPIVTIGEFKRVQDALKKPVKTRRNKHSFPLTGIIQCGGCGLGITAELRTNKYGSRYTYYHCSRRGIGPRCPERAVTARDLEDQVVAFLESLTVPPEVGAWLTAQFKKSQVQGEAVETARRASLAATLQETDAQLDELTGLRLRRLLTDEEFLTRRERLAAEQVRLRRLLENPDRPEERFELFENVLWFRKYAVEWFRSGDERTKRLILKIVGSNFSLKGKILSIQAAKPFLSPPFFDQNPRQRADADATRNFFAQTNIKTDRLVQSLSDALDDAQSNGIGLKLKELRKWNAIKIG